MRISEILQKNFLVKARYCISLFFISLLLCWDNISFRSINKISNEPSDWHSVVSCTPNRIYVMLQSQASYFKDVNYCFFINVKLQ